MYIDNHLWSFTKGVRGRIGAAVGVGLLAASVGVARLALLGWLLARVFAGDPVEQLIWPFICVALVMLLRGALEYWRNMMAHETATRVQLHLRKLLYDKIVQLGPAYFGLERTGDALLSVVEGVERLEVYFGQYLPQLFVCAFVPLVVFAFVAFLDLPIALVMLGFALLALFAPAVFHKWDSANATGRQRAYADFSAEFLDSLQGLATLQAFGQSKTRGKLLAEKAYELFRRTMWVLATNSLSRGITDTCIAVGAATMLSLGAYRVIEDAMTMTALLMILLMGVEVFRPLRDMRILLHDGMLGAAAAKGIVDLLGKTGLIDRPSGSSRSETLEPTVEFDEVNFTYPGGRRHAHKNLSFRVDAGERIGVVGSSGCGKSSIVRLLLRLYDPQQGTIRLGNEDVRDLPEDELFRHIAVVNQDTYLFHGTVEENLRFGKPDASNEELASAARTANAHEFIMRLPQGYDTIVGERGIKLSGGQRQRIAIARAVLRDAPILVLDEALSAVDTENEAIIQEALERIMQGRTTLIFAHRLSSVIDADRLLVLDEGELVESGTHAELMAAGGTYHALMSGQIERVQRHDLTDVGRRPGTETQEEDEDAWRTAYLEPTDGILRAEGLGWLDVLRELMAMVVPWRGRLIVTFALGVARVCAFIGVGVISALIVAAVKNELDFTNLLIILFVIAPLAGILHWLESWIAHDMAFRLLAELRIGLFKKLDELGPAYLVRRRSGDLVATATHDVELVEYFFAHTVAPAFVAVLVPAAVIATLLVYGWLMALALLPILLVVGLSPILTRRRIDDVGSRAREALGNLNAHVVDTIQGLNEILAFQQVSHRRKEFVQKIEENHRLRLTFFRDLTFQMALLEVATGMGGLVVVIAGAVLVNNGALQSSTLPLLTLLAMAAFLPVSEIAHVGRQLADTLGSTRRLYAVHNEETTVRDGTQRIEEDDQNDFYIEMENVNFSYFGSKRRALDDISFKAATGKTLALVGPSGSGKTTAAHLLMRFWDPENGKINILGKDLRSLPVEQVRGHIALVTQDTYLFNTTLRANIHIARPEASEKAVMEAVSRAALTDFVESLPEGLETSVGERGVRLSGGQRQRVAIARAFLKDAPVLILDEATSHLDAINERLVHGALEELMSDRTTVVIAHRLSTVRNADEIVVLHDGRVAEIGNHDALMSAGGLYSQLVGRQLSSAALA